MLIDACVFSRDPERKALLNYFVCQGGSWGDAHPLSDTMTISSSSAIQTKITPNAVCDTALFKP